MRSASASTPTSKQCRSLSPSTNANCTRSRPKLNNVSALANYSLLFLFEDDSAIHDLKTRKIEQLPGYGVWRNELNQVIAGIIKKEIDNIDSRIATQAELNLTNSRLHDMEGKFNVFMKKTSADIIDIKSKFDIESLKQMFVTK